MTIPGTVTTPGVFAPSATTDTYPTHDAQYGRGGVHHVADTTARDAIPAERRVAGMLCTVESDGKIYKLGQDLVTWSELQTGGASDWNSITGKPSTFPPSAHTHAISDVTGLSTQLSNLSTDIGNEASTRASADSALTTAINNEISARSSADSALASDISNRIVIGTGIADTRLLVGESATAAGGSVDLTWNRTSKILTVAGTTVSNTIRVSDQAGTGQRLVTVAADGTQLAITQAIWNPTSLAIEIDGGRFMVKASGSPTFGADMILARSNTGTEFASVIWQNSYAYSTAKQWSMGLRTGDAAGLYIWSDVSDAQMAKLTQSGGAPAWDFRNTGGAGSVTVSSFTANGAATFNSTLTISGQSGATSRLAEFDTSGKPVARADSVTTADSVSVPRMFAVGGGSPNPHTDFGILRANTTRFANFIWGEGTSASSYTGYWALGFRANDTSRDLVLWSDNLGIEQGRIQAATTPVYIFATTGNLGIVRTGTLRAFDQAGSGNRFVAAQTDGTQLALSSSAATALLDAFTSVAKGLTPASGGGTTNFLRADGTWAAPTFSVTASGVSFTPTGNVTSTNVQAAIAELDTLKINASTLSGLATSSITGTMTLTKLGSTAQLITFPDAAIIVAGSASALTIGSVPYVTTNGLLTTSANLTYADGVGMTITGGYIDAKINSGVGNAPLGAGYFRGHTTGTPAAGHGVTLSFTADTSTSLDVTQGSFRYVWADVTHASRRARWQLYVHDATNAREGIRVETDGSVAQTYIINSAAVGATALVGSERLRIAGGVTPTTPGAGDMLFGNGVLASAAGDPIRLTGGQGNAYVAYYNGTTLRFRVGIQTTESGANTGSNWAVFAYDDAGNFLRNALTVTRSTGDAAFGAAVSATTLTARPAAGNEGITIAGRAAGASSWTVTVQPSATTGLSANRTVSIADADGHVVTSVGVMTADGRIPYLTNTANGNQVTASASLVWNNSTTTLAVSGLCSITGYVEAFQAAGGSGVFQGKVTGDANPRFQVLANGAIHLGDGTVAPTTFVDASRNVTCGTLNSAGAATFQAGFTENTGIAAVGTNSAASVILSLNSAINTNRGIAFRTAGSLRWYMYSTGTESGSDAGCNLTFRAYTDAGVTIDDMLVFNRAAGGSIVSTRPISIQQGTLTAASSPLAVSTTWNNAAITMTGLSMSVTDTASAAESWLLDFTVSGNPQLRLLKGGQLVLGGTASAFPSATYDPYGVIIRSGGGGTGGFAQAGAMVYRPRVSAVVGRGSHWFYSGSTPSVAVVITETQQLLVNNTAAAASEIARFSGGSVPSNQTTTDVLFGAGCGLFGSTSSSSIQTLGGIVAATAIEVTTAGSGFIARSPDSTRRMLMGVNNASYLRTVDQTTSAVQTYAPISSLGADASANEAVIGSDNRLPSQHPAYPGRSMPVLPPSSFGGFPSAPKAPTHRIDAAVANLGV